MNTQSIERESKRNSCTVVDVTTGYFTYRVFSCLYPIRFVRDFRNFYHGSSHRFGAVKTLVHICVAIDALKLLVSHKLQHNKLDVSLS